jgi:Flp pilus assembly protein TadD
LFQRALIIDPLDVEAMAGLGWCYVELERCADAAPVFEAALQIDPYSERARAGTEACPAEPETVTDEPE